MGRRLNGDAWDQPSATARLGKLSIPLDRRAGELSGGQQAQVALTIALVDPSAARLTSSGPLDGCR
jgi:ABC-2 type transport system ATP-binding protein